MKRTEYVLLIPSIPRPEMSNLFTFSNLSLTLFSVFVQTSVYYHPFHKRGRETERWRERDRENIFMMFFVIVISSNVNIFIIKNYYK